MGEMQPVSSDTAAGAETRASLRLEGVRRSFGARRVLPGITLEASGGEVVAVVGPNGSGKSTLLKIVAGLMRPTRGKIVLTVPGAPPIEDAAGRRARVGYAGPDLALYPELTGRENLEFFATVAGRPLSKQESSKRLAAVGLGGRGDDPVSVYSSGMRQRLRLAFARGGGDAPLLLLDEPSLALDERGVALVAQMVAEQRERGGLTLLATNDPREVALGDRSVVLGA
jgi:ABC-type multidrug transport system, ATPase component